jgi:hypothetical protein
LETGGQDKDETGGSAASSSAPSDGRRMGPDAPFRFRKLHGEAWGRVGSGTDGDEPAHPTRFQCSGFASCPYVQAGTCIAPSPAPHPAILPLPALRASPILPRHAMAAYGAKALRLAVPFVLREAGHARDAGLLGASPGKGAADDSGGYGDWASVLREAGRMLGALPGKGTADDGEGYSG